MAPSSDRRRGFYDHWDFSSVCCIDKPADARRAASFLAKNRPCPRAFQHISAFIVYLFLGDDPVGFFLPFDGSRSVTTAQAPGDNGINVVGVFGARRR